MPIQPLQKIWVFPKTNLQVKWTFEESILG